MVGLGGVDVPIPLECLVTKMVPATLILGLVRSIRSRQTMETITATQVIVRRREVPESASLNISCW